MKWANQSNASEAEEVTRRGGGEECNETLLFLSVRKWWNGECKLKVGRKAESVKV